MPSVPEADILLVDLPDGISELVIAAPSAAELDEQSRERWHAILARNPHAHDGDICAVRGFDALAGRLIVAHDRYSRLAVQHEPDAKDLGVRIVGLKAVFLGRDRSGNEHLFIQRRHPNTRIYGGQWEVGPGGGFELARGAATLSPADLFHALLEEVQSEIGLDLRDAYAPPVSTPRPAFVLLDPIARSFDLCWMLRWPGVVDPKRGVCGSQLGCGASGWEVTDTSWISPADAQPFVDRAREAICPPMLAVLRKLGWIR